MTSLGPMALPVEWERRFMALREEFGTLDQRAAVRADVGDEAWYRRESDFSSRVADLWWEMFQDDGAATPAVIALLADAVGHRRHLAAEFNRAADQAAERARLAAIKPEGSS